MTGTFIAAFLRGQRVRLLLVALGIATLPASVLAQADYPRRLVQVILPLQAGTGSDTAVRTLATRLSESMGQSFVVENLPAAGGLVGAEKLVKAAPDGYVLGAFNNGVLTVLPQIGAKAAFDPFNDFVPLGRIALIPSVLVVPVDFPARTIAELVTLSKGAPGKFNYASVGVGSVQHLGMELLKAGTGINLTHVPYKGGVQAMVSVIAGETQAVFIGVSVALQHIKSGKVRALAVGGAQRSALLPDVPTVQEAGIAGFIYEPWLALYAPRGAPTALVARLNAEIGKALAPAEVRDRLLLQGLEVRTSTPEELAALIRSESQEMAKVIKLAGIKAE